MSLEYIFESIIGALICAFICGGWYLLDCWLDDVSTRRWRKKMDKLSARKEEIMKKLFMLAGILLMACSCITTNKTVYEYTITYTIAGTEITEVHSIDMPSQYVPSYRLDQNSLKIIGSYGTSSMPYTTIYKGSLSVEVIDFDYKTIRNYKASGWDGHEIKHKRNP